MNEFEKAIYIHSKALAAHCECLAMNAENMCRVVENTPPAYPDAHYYQVMEKWGLIDNTGEPTF